MNLNAYQMLCSLLTIYKKAELRLYNAVNENKNDRNIQKKLLHIFN